MKVFDIAPVKFTDDKMMILDQTRLPGEEVYIEAKTKEDVWDAIYHLRVRGAPAIGVAAGYGLYVSVRGYEGGDIEGFRKLVKENSEYLNSARPTAVNLSWALKRMERVLDEAIGTAGGGLTVEKAKALMLSEAEKIRIEDEKACRAMGEYGLSLLKPGMGILTHCNAGHLAVSEYGTALAPIYLGEERGYHFHVFADETRPLLQGARLTAYELQKAGVDVTLICDNMASSVMQKGWVQAVVVGCDRVAANGDVANKIGTSGVAILARHYGIPFYVLGPTSTIDMACPDGQSIRIEERSAEEVTTMWYAQRMAPADVRVYNPSFDVTPHELVTAIITERGIFRPPFTNLGAEN